MTAGEDASARPDDAQTTGPNIGADAGDAALTADATVDAPITYPSTCGDGSKNNGETAIDCGGPNCVPCEQNKPCIAPTDCQSGKCRGLCTGSGAICEGTVDCTGGANCVSYVCAQ